MNDNGRVSENPDGKWIYLDSWERSVPDGTYYVTVDRRDGATNFVINTLVAMPFAQPQKTTDLTDSEVRYYRHFTIVTSKPGHITYAWGHDGKPPPGLFCTYNIIP